VDKVEQDTISHVSQCAGTQLKERLMQADEEQGEGFIEGSFDEPTAWRLWSLVLLLAVRDRASSVHFQAREDDTLSYVVDTIRYAMVPPPTDLFPFLLSAWRSRLSPGWFRKASRWLLGDQRAPVSGLVRLWAGEASTDWFVVCGREDDLEHVDLYRVTAVPPAEPVQEIRL
jgi:hypothetical protein